jgi:hypothetical protein
MGRYSTIERLESDTLSPSIEETTFTLLTLPLELRQYIYDNVFQSGGCNETSGCHCGDNLSITNRQLYQETRPLVYRYAKPRFLDIESCIRFLRDIKDNVVYIKSLSIIDWELSSQSYRLADVFRHKGLEGLQVFKFVVKPWLKSSQRIEHHTPPIYSLFEEKHSPAAVYDASLRVSRHPLAEMKHLRSLAVKGYPQSDIEEAIFKASRNIEELGRKEGKSVKRWEMESDRADRNGADGWAYSIEIVD